MHCPAEQPHVLQSGWSMAPSATTIINKCECFIDLKNTIIVPEQTGQYLHTNASGHYTG